MQSGCGMVRLVVCRSRPRCCMSRLMRMADCASKPTQPRVCHTFASVVRATRSAVHVYKRACVRACVLAGWPASPQTQPNSERNVGLFGQTFCRLARLSPACLPACPALPCRPRSCPQELPDDGTQSRRRPNGKCTIARSPRRPVHMSIPYTPALLS